MPVQRSLLLLFFFIMVFSACEKDKNIAKAPAIVPSVEKADTGGAAPALVVRFNAVSNSQALVTESKWYSNSSNDHYTVTKFNYYISNVRLKKEDGTYYSEPESYHLIKYAEDVRTFTIQNLPQGNYTGIEFLIGVDSIRNFS